MGDPYPTSEVEPTVAIAVAMRSPEPAAVRCLLDFHPESSLRTHGAVIVCRWDGSIAAATTPSSKVQPSRQIELAGGTVEVDHVRDSRMALECFWTRARSAAFRSPKFSS